MIAESTPTRIRSGRRWLAFALVIVLAVAGLAWWYGIGAGPSPEQRQAAADELAAAIRVSASVDSLEIVAARAVADFGIEEGISLVSVRIVDTLAMDVTIESARQVTLAGLPSLCFYGPDPAPDDAGLESRCWGSPDLGELLAAAEGARTDTDGRLLLAAGQPLTFHAELSRGGERCDYPLGTWTLDLLANPMVDGAPAGPRYVPPANLELMADRQQMTARLPLLLTTQSHYCGLVTRAVWEQGEPEVIRP